MCTSLKIRVPFLPDFLPFEDKYLLASAFWVVKLGLHSSTWRKANLPFMDANMRFSTPFGVGISDAKSMFHTF